MISPLYGGASTPHLYRLIVHIAVALRVQARLAFSTCCAFCIRIRIGNRSLRLRHIVRVNRVGALMIVRVKVPADRRSRIRVRSTDQSKRIIDHVQERVHLRLPLLKTRPPVLARVMILMTRHAGHHVHRHHMERREHLLDLRVALPLLLQLGQATAPLLLRDVSQQELDVELLDRVLIQVASIRSRAQVLNLHTDPMELHEVGPLRSLANGVAARLDAVEVPCVRVAAAGDVLRVARDASVARHPLVVVRIVDRSLGHDLARLPVERGLAGDAKHLAAS